MLPGERNWMRETEQTPEEYAVTSEMDSLDERADSIREAWDAWADFNRALHTLTPPKEIVQAWDAIRPWLEAEGKKVREQLDELGDHLEEVVNYF